MSRATTRKKHKRHWTTVIPANFEVRVRCCGKLHTLKLLPTGELIPLNHKGWDDDLDRVLVYSGEDLRCHKVLQSWRTIFKDKYISPEHKTILPKGRWTKFGYYSGEFSKGCQFSSGRLYAND